MPIRALVRSLLEYEPSFTNYQMIVLRDKPLAYLHGFLMVFVVLYELVYITVLYHQYAAFETPIGHANFYDGPIEGEVPPMNLTSYCGNDSYTWGFDLSAQEKIVAGGYAFNFSGPCVPFSRSKHTQMGTDIFSVVTQETTLYENGTVEQYMIHAPELAPMNMIHVLSATFYPTGIVNPPTHIRDKNGNIILSFDNAAPVSLTVKQCIDIAGGDLEARCTPPTASIAPRRAAKSPPSRKRAVAPRAHPTSLPGPKRVCLRRRRLRRRRRQQSRPVKASQTVRTGRPISGRACVRRRPSARSRRESLHHRPPGGVSHVQDFRRQPR